MSENRERMVENRVRMAENRERIPANCEDSLQWKAPYSKTSPCAGSFTTTVEFFS